MKSKKFKIGDRVIDKDSGDEGTIVQYDKDIDNLMTCAHEIWVLWDDTNKRLWIPEAELKKKKQPKESSTDENTITFKNGIKSMKKAFRGATVKYSGTFGHITGYARPKNEESDDITVLYLNIYGQHYYADAIEVELL